MEIQEQVNAAPTASAQKYYLDGSEITLMALQEKRQDPKVKIVLVEGTTNQYKTKTRLYDKNVFSQNKSR